MGLENGISIYRKSEHKEYDNVYDYINSLEYIDTTDIDLDIYWCRCWQLRNDMIDALGDEHSECYYIINKDNFKDLKEVIHYYYFTFDGIKKWDEDGLNSWDDPYKWYNINNQFEYTICRIHLMFKRIRIGKHLMKKLDRIEKEYLNDNYEVVFWDSY